MSAKRWARQLLAMVFLSGAFWCGAEEPLRVVATIKPLQLLVAAVGGDAVQAELLLSPNLSPHDYQLRPSDRRRLDAAEVVVWSGPQLENFLPSILASLPQTARPLALHHDGGDPHVWLDPLAMAAAADGLALLFGELRPAQAEHFQASAQRLQQQLRDEDARLRQRLTAAGPLRGYMVEHDAYSRFERRYGLQHQAALTDSSELPPSPAQMLRVQRLLDSGAITCVWREKQRSRLLDRLLSGRDIRVEVIDAMAVDQPLSNEGLVLFYRRLGESVMNCFAGTGKAAG